MKSKAKEILVGMKDEEWRKLILRLTRYAYSVSRRLRWRTRSRSELPGGESVESIVSKALEKVLAGERKWDPDRHPRLDGYLMDVVDSLSVTSCTKHRQPSFGGDS